MSTLFHVIVCAAILNPQKKVLLARRKPEKILGGLWEFPGGKLESSESLEDALKREIREELAITISSPELLHIKPYRYDHGQVLILFYVCDWLTGEPKLLDHDQYVWCDVAEVKNYDLLPANHELVAKLTQKIKTSLS